MSYVNELRTQAGYTRTMNGAMTHGATGSACLDLFAVAGGSRHKEAGELIRLFDKAYIEDPELAMKLLFYIRDVRGGLGERDMFRTLIRHVAKTWPASAQKNVALISEYGRFDDLMCLMGTSSQKEVLAVIRSQLAADEEALAARENGRKNAHISLLAKWLPSINTSSRRTRGQAKVLARALGLNEADYRRRLSRLRANIGLTERYLTARKAEKIRYDSVPAGAMLKYRTAFASHDAARFSDYLTNVLTDEQTIHTSSLYPYEIIRPFMGRNNWYKPDRKIKGKEVLEVLWNHQEGTVNSKNAISVIDTSGSMYWSRPGTPMPALISQSLGLYYAERCTGTFHNMFITFESRPHLVEIQGQTLKDKLRYIQCADWGGSTDLEAVFDLILRAAIADKTPRHEMPATLYIISDMEFNCAVRDPDRTIYENAKARFKAEGYQLPAVVFHNVNSWQMQAPVHSRTRGAALVSGAGTNSFKYKFDGNITPMDHMLRVLNSPRYDAVHA